MERMITAEGAENAKEYEEKDKFLLLIFASFAVRYS
jgi:hypothetical protein